MNMKYRIVASLLFVCALGGAAEDKGAAPDNKDKKDEKEIRKAVRFSPMARRIADLDLAVAGPASIAKTMEVPGQIMLNAEKLARVTPRLSGIATRIHVKVGDKVAVGDILASIESIELGSAKNDYLAAKTTLEFAKADLEREQQIHEHTGKFLALAKSDPDPSEFEKAAAELPLGEIKAKVLAASSSMRIASSAFQRAQKLQTDNLITAAAFESAQNDSENARTGYRGVIEELKLNYTQRLLLAQRAVLTNTAALTNAERRLGLLGVASEQLAHLAEEKTDKLSLYEIKAPADGTVIDQPAVLGEHVDSTREMFTIADLSTVWVELRINTNCLAEIKAGQPVRLAIRDQSISLDSKIAWISPLADAHTRSVAARVVLDNSAGKLKPGLFVTSEIVLAETKVPLAVPLESLQTFEGKDVVFVNEEELNDGEFFITPILTGQMDSRFVEIKAGLKPGARIAARNSFNLKAEAGKGGGDD